MYIAIDVGGTNIRVASFTSPQDPQIIDSVKIRNLDDYPQDFQNIAEAIENLSDGKVLEGIGIGIPCVLDETKTIIKRAVNVKTWREKDLKGELEARFECPVRMDNDATIAALGEAIYGHGQDRDFVFIIWGTDWWDSGRAHRWETAPYPLRTRASGDQTKRSGVFLWSKRVPGGNLRRWRD